jgi:uncharacterized protein (DUF924 family)
MEQAEEVLQFWFGSLDEDGFADSAQGKLWFAGKGADAVIAGRFTGLVERALAGELDDWAEQPASLIALITLLDQFPRNIYRSSAMAFSGDGRASDLVNRAIAAGLDRQMPIAWRSMFYLPLEHAENLAEQNLSVAMFELLLAEVPAVRRAELAGNLDWARRHRDIIARFGRFPHRNAAMQRQPTPEESAWLDGGGDRFGQ